MEDLCTACLCAGRKLYFIGETGSYHLYSQILNEIPVYDFSDVCVRVCWECRALLRRFREFKVLVKKSYADLLQQLHQNSPPSKYSLARPSRLREQTVACLGWPEHDVKQEDNTHVLIEVDSKPLKEEPPHSEPEAEAFIGEVEVKRVKKKKTTKKTSKGKSKKKLKSKSRKLEENKINTKKKEAEAQSISSEDGVFVDDISDQDAEDYDDDVVLEVIKEKRERIVSKSKKTEAKPDRVTITKVKVNNVNKIDIPVREVPVEFETEPPKPNGLPKQKREKEPEIIGDKPKCVECGKVFSSKKTYRYHLNVLHKGQNRYPCGRCGKVYQWKSNLGRHMRTHKARDSGELYCDTCDKKFASVATFRQHLRVSRRHVTENEFSFMCNECGKKFVNKTRLRDHVDWEHLHNIKFRCQLCNKPFKCHTSLYVHMQNVHRNKKKENLCHICGKSYQNAAKLKYHIVAMHTSETPYQCQQCAAAFGWYSSLYRHIREVHYKMKIAPKKMRKTKRPLEPAPPPRPALGPAPPSLAASLTHPPML